MLVTNHCVHHRLPRPDWNGHHGYRLGVLGAAFGLFFVCAACGSQQESGQNNARSAGGGKSDLDVEQATGGAVVDIPAKSIYRDTCGKIAALSLPAHLQPYRTRFCDGGQPLPLLALTLPARAYQGAGEVKLLKLGEQAPDPQGLTTALTVGGAVELPVTAAYYFKKMAEFMDDHAAAAALGVTLIASGQVTETTLAVVPGVPYGQGPGLIGGWKKRLQIVNQVSGQTISSEYEQQADYYELLAGKAYLITTYLTASLQGVKDSVMFTIIVQDGEKAFLVSQIYTKTEHRGLPSVARDTLTTLFRDGIKNAFENGRRIAQSPVKN